MGLFSWIGDIFEEIVSWFVDIPEIEDHDEKSQGTLLNKQSNIAPIPVIYGERKVGGTRVFVETTGTDNVDLYICLVLSEGEVNAIGDVYINDTISTDSKFSGLVTIEKNLGADDQAQSTLLSSAPSWTGTARKLSGVAYLAMKFVWDQDVFGSLPVVTAVVQGQKCYDPRDSTTDYTTNPALCLLDYLKNDRYGKGLPVSAFESDYASWEIAADLCDALVLSYTGGAYIDLFSCNAILNTDRTIIENVKELLSGMRGLMPYTQGMYRLIIENNTSSVFAFDESMIVGGININGESKSERYNRVIATFANPDRNWQQDQIEYPASGSSEYTTYLSEDNGFELIKEVSLPAITNVYQAEDIAELILKRSRTGLRCSFLATSEALEVAVGDVVTVTHSTPSWTSKKFRVLGLTLRKGGAVGVTAVEHDGTIYPWQTKTQATAITDPNFPDTYSVEGGVTTYIQATPPSTTEAGAMWFDSDDDNKPYIYDGTTPFNTIAGSFVVGTTYIITAVGTTDFTAIGATASTVGIRFTASGVGTGTGTACKGWIVADSQIIDVSTGGSTLQTGTTGARLVVADGAIKVWDSAGQLRIHLGDLDA